jgi:hypothetical protein
MDVSSFAAELIASMVVGLASGAFGSYLGFRLQFERRKGWEAWREDISEEMDSHVGRIGQLERFGVMRADLEAQVKENRESIQRIYDLIERGAREAKEDRHALRNDVTAVLAELRADLAKVATRLAVQESRSQD